jgi:hypothetical protein
MGTVKITKDGWTRVIDEMDEIPAGWEQVGGCIDIEPEASFTERQEIVGVETEPIELPPAPKPAPKVTKKPARKKK